MIPKKAKLASTSPTPIGHSKNKPDTDKIKPIPDIPALIKSLFLFSSLNALSCICSKYFVIEISKSKVFNISFFLKLLTKHVSLFWYIKSLTIFSISSILGLLFGSFSTNLSIKFCKSSP